MTKMFSERHTMYRGCDVFGPGRVGMGDPYTTIVVVKNGLNMIVRMDDRDPLVVMAAIRKMVREMNDHLAKQEVPS